MRIPRSLFSAFVLVLGCLLVKAAPVSQDWQNLNKTLEGRLSLATPFAISCFSQYDNQVIQPQQASCEEIQANYTSSSYRTDFFSAYMNSQDESCANNPANQCLLDPQAVTSSEATTNVSCNQGSVPAYYIEVQNAQDVAAAFSFASSTNTSIAVKNSGHDYNGRSSGPGTLALWTRNLQNLTYQASFVPDGCSSSQHPATAAIITGAGVNFDQVYSFAHQQNVTFVGGSGPIVGASGGWTLTGGHGVLSRVYGLGIDRVLQFTVVTPDGNVRTANACSNPDLFWALRGGGGSTFGVVLATVHRVEPTLPLSTVLMTIPSTAAASVQSDFLDLIVNSTLDWANDGWGGVQSSTTVFLATPLLDLNAAKASMASAASFISANNGSIDFERLPDWYTLYTKFVLPTAQPAGSATFSHNRIIPTSLFQTSSGRAQIRAYIDWLRSVGLVPQILATTPYLYSGNGANSTGSNDATAGGSSSSSTVEPFAYDNGNASATSATPAWRSGAVLLSSVTQWAYNASLEDREKVVDLWAQNDANSSALAPTSASGGSYANEASPWTEQWQDDFWGSNHARLALVKKQVDPDGLLGCWHCVGSESRGTSLPVGGRCLGALGSG